MTMKVYQWPLAADYLESLAPEMQKRVTSTIDKLAKHFPEKGSAVDIDGSDGVLVARLSQSEAGSEKVLVIEVTPEARERALKAAGLPAPSKKRQLTREEAAAIVKAGIGKGTKWSSGAEYVDNVRHIWKGLASSADSAP